MIQLFEPYNSPSRFELRENELMMRRVNGSVSDHT